LICFYVLPTKHTTNKANAIQQTSNTEAPTETETETEPNDTNTDKQTK